jgi:oligopeptide/dipeptide ABC transporter ATP-binding protein
MEETKTDDRTVLHVNHLKTYFFTNEGVAKAVDDISFRLGQGEPLGLVGESGCGKSVTALSILRLIPFPPGRVQGGGIILKGTDLLKLPESEMRRVRGNRISMIFQEPMTSLNPVFTIVNQIQEAIQLHQKLSRKESFEKTLEMLRLVHIPSPERCVKQYPHELSGGMRQRVMIAMAMACGPEILIADEPTTALDVTIQAQILELMAELQRDLGMALILITHNLGLIAETVGRVIVMYAGKIVEEAPTKSLFQNPQHPYTMGLLKSVPRLGDKVRIGKMRLSEIPGVVPSLYELPQGCRFSTRCSVAMNICLEKEPDLREIEQGHFISCWLADR